jgi:hypothetical protein
MTDHSRWTTRGVRPAPATPRVDALDARLAAMEARMEQLAMGMAILLGYRPEVEAQRQRKQAQQRALTSAHDCWVRPARAPGGRNEWTTAHCACGWVTLPAPFRETERQVLDHYAQAKRDMGLDLLMVSP